MIITAFFAIEVWRRLDMRVCLLMRTALFAAQVIVVMPYVFSILGWDQLAIEFTYLVILTTTISQIPKRFVWRFRPYMVRRARAVGKDGTSSFPSRAVTCSVVYTYALCFAYQSLFAPGQVFQWWMILVLLVCDRSLTSAVSHAPVLLCAVIDYSIVAGAADIGRSLPVRLRRGCAPGAGHLRRGHHRLAPRRHRVSAHGCLRWFVSSDERDGGGGRCASCENHGCYTTDSNMISWWHLQLNWWMFSVAFVVMTLVAVLCIVRPLQFWIKCDRVYGYVHTPQSSCMLKSHLLAQHPVPLHSFPAGVSVSAHLAHVAAPAARCPVVYISVCVGLRRCGHSKLLIDSLFLVYSSHPHMLSGCWHEAEMPLAAALRMGVSVCIFLSSGLAADNHQPLVNKCSSVNVDEVKCSAIYFFSFSSEAPRENACVVAVELTAHIIRPSAYISFFAF